MVKILIAMYTKAITMAMRGGAAAIRWLISRARAPRAPRMAAGITIALLVLMVLMRHTSPVIPAPVPTTVPGQSQEAPPPGGPPVLHHGFAADMTLFPEPPGVTVQNFSHTRIEATTLRAAMWAVHVTDPTQPATLTLRWTPPRTIAGATLRVHIQLLDNPRVMVPLLEPTADIVPLLQIYSAGTEIRPDGPMLRAATSAESMVHLPAPSAGELVFVVTIPPRLLAHMVTITMLEVLTW